MHRHSDTRVEAVAKATYSVAVNRAKIAINESGYNPEDIPRIFRALRRESQTAQILIFSSYLEDCVKSLLKDRCKHIETKNLEAKVFGGNGPLGSFSNRLLIAYQFGWISQHTMDRLSAFRSIRNEFAHRAFDTKIADQNIKDHIKALSIDIQPYIELAKSSLNKEKYDLTYKNYDDLSSQEQLLVQFLFLHDTTVQDLMILPHALENRVSPRDISIDFDQSPELVRRHRLLSGEAFLQLILNETKVSASRG